MKKLIFSVFLISMLFNQALFSQNPQPYFDVIYDVNLYSPPLPFGEGIIYFDLEEINSVFLDIAITQDQDGLDRFGQWNENNGNGTFGGYTTFTTPISGELINNIFLKLRSSSSKKDFFVGQSNGYQIYYNDNGNIIPTQHNYNGGSNWKFIESGVFNNGDYSEDILVSDGSNTLIYFVNNSNGSLQGPNYLTLDYNVYNFKLKQLDERADGYAQSDPLNRFDLVFLYRDTDPQTYDKVYAHLNNNQNGFSSRTFANFTSDYNTIIDLEVADIDGDGYNDVILLCKNEVCDGILYAQIYQNWYGEYINYSTKIWSCTVSEEVLCAGSPKITVADFNKDGWNDLVFIYPLDDNLPDGSGIKAKVFINLTYPPYFNQIEDEEIEISHNDYAPNISKAVTADIYGSQQDDGGGIALLVSYYVPLSGNTGEFHVKVVNAYYTRQESPPPPPIVQGFLEEDQQPGIWHPHLHLDSRGERDFDHFEIWKYKWGMQGFERIVPNWQDTGWTDYSECVIVSGGDLPAPNCYYYAKSVDINYKVSVPSLQEGYRVDCTPVCDGCTGGDNPIQNSNQNLDSKRTPEKFSVSSYPNPFNPTIKINYALPIASNVTIKVFDVMGKIVKELVNDYKNAGYYTLVFDGSSLSSGIYFYRIETMDFTTVNKIVLIK